MSESELLAHIAARSADLAARFPNLIVGPGDDCALVRTPSGDHLLLTVDHLVEGRHFDSSSPIDLIARKALARSVSDIAAMAGTPLWTLATGALPPAYPHADTLFDQMSRWARHWQCPLVGGDISSTSGPLVLTVTIIGAPHPRGSVLRSAAQPGDALYVTGTLGHSLRSGRHLTFEPRLREARQLADTLADLHAMMDISDGLGRDASRIAAASGVRIDIEAALLPCSPGADWRSAMSDGEDYELLFTASGEVPPDVAGTPITRIGRISAGAGCFVTTPDGAVLDASTMGWDH